MFHWRFDHLDFDLAGMICHLFICWKIVEFCRAHVRSLIGVNINEASRIQICSRCAYVQCLKIGFSRHAKYDVRIWSDWKTSTDLAVNSPPTLKVGVFFFIHICFSHAIHNPCHASILITWIAMHCIKGNIHHLCTHCGGHSNQKSSKKYYKDQF